MKKEKEFKLIDKLDILGIAKDILCFIIKKYKKIKKQSRIAKNVESAIIETFNKYMTNYDSLVDICESEKLNIFIEMYCENYNQDESINSFIIDNSLIGIKAQQVRDFLRDLANNVLDVYVKEMSNENKALKKAIVSEIEDSINKQSYDVENLINKIFECVFDANLDLLKETFDFIDNYTLTREDANLIKYIKELIYTGHNANIDIKTSNINIILKLVRLNFLFGNSDLSNIQNLNLLDKEIQNLINNYKNNKLNVYLSDKADPSNSTDDILLSLIREVIFFYFLRRNEFTFCEIFYKNNLIQSQCKLIKLSYSLVHSNTLRNNYEVNPTIENKNALYNTLLNIQDFIVNISHLNKELSLAYVVPFARLLNFDSEKLKYYVQKLPTSTSTHPSILYEIELSRIDLKSEKPINIITQCKQNNSTILLKRFIMEKYIRPCTGVINFFEQYDVLETFMDADLFSIYATSLIDSKKYNAEKTLNKIKKLSSKYKNFIDYDIICGLYNIKYQKSKVNTIANKLKSQLKSLKIGGMAFSNLIRFIANSQSDELLKELLCLNLIDNAKLDIAEILYRNNLKRYATDILEILNTFTNLDSHFSKMKADCLWLSKENKLALMEYKKVLLECQSVNIYDKVLALSLKLDETIEDNLLLNLSKIDNYGIQYNLGIYYRKHNQVELSKKHILQSLLLNDKQSLSKEGMFHLIIEDKVQAPFVCDSIKPNIVAYLEGKEKSITLFVHESNIDFTDKSSSYDAVHIKFNDSRLNDLRCKSVGETTCFEDNEYKITKLLPLEKVVFDDCMQDLSKNKTIQTITSNNIEEFKDFVKSLLKDSKKVISSTIEKYNQLGQNLKCPYSFLSTHIYKTGLEGYRAILINPSIYKINSTAHFDDEMKYICCYDVICLCAILNLKNIDTSSFYISSITKNKLLTEANERINDLAMQKRQGYMCLHDDNLYLLEENSSEMRDSYSFYSNIIDIVSKMKEITPQKILKEEIEFKNALKELYSDYEIESITCAKEYKYRLLTDDISLIKIGNRYNIASIGVIDIILRNCNEKEIINNLNSLKKYGFYNFIDSNVIEMLDHSSTLTEIDYMNLVDVSYMSNNFEDVCIENYRYYLNKNLDYISSNKILSAMFNYVKNDLLKKYTFQRNIDSETGQE